jgi:redox-sensitive bicupin YhaK (pirin superfamily)
MIRDMADMDPNPIRTIDQVLPSRETMEGAGVHLRRAFGYHEVPRLDPFLLLDDFRSENPAEFIAGFPWHPHRGIETVTYMLDGLVQHEDSIGNKGIIGSGDVQWMTAGNGIIHQEMPKHLEDGRMGGFQLWVNLPASSKMMDPRYQEVKNAQIPEVEAAKGVHVRVIAGMLRDVRGPVRDIVVEPEYLDVRIAPHAVFDHSVKKGHRVFAYVLDGKGRFDEESGETVDSENLVLFRDGARVRIEAADRPLRFLLISGKPLHEPVAWWGPIVMNNRRELEVAVEEFQNGTFVKRAAQVQ